MEKYFNIYVDCSAIDKFRMIKTLWIYLPFVSEDAKCEFNDQELYTIIKEHKQIDILCGKKFYSLDTSKDLKLCSVIFNVAFRKSNFLENIVATLKNQMII